MISLALGLVAGWLRRHRVRTALALLAVALGVAAFLASFAVGRSVSTASTAVFARLAGGADLSVEAPDAGLPAAVLRGVEEVAGVAAAAPLATGWLRVDGATGGRVLLVGVDPVREPALGRRGAPPPEEQAGEVGDPAAFGMGLAALLTRPLAEELGVGPGDRVLVYGARGPVRLGVTGVVDPVGPRGAAGGRMIVAVLARVQGLVGRPGLVDRVDVRLAAGADRSAVTDGVRGVVEAAGAVGAHVGPPRMRDTSAEEVLGTVNIALRVGAVVALLIGVFLIHHTLSVGVAERRREIGVLRAIGATRRQVAFVFCAEAVAVGLAGSLLGVGLAYALARGALAGFASALSATYFSGGVPEVEVPAELAVAGVVVGVAVSLLAAILPARAAAREAPSDAIRRGQQESASHTGSRRLRLAVGIVSGVLTAVMLVRPETAGRWSAYVALVGPMVGFLAVAPLVLAWFARLLAPLLGRLGGVAGRLAMDDLLRNPRRAALPAAALAFGLALVVETRGVVVSLSEETVSWMEQSVAGDLFVSSGRRVMGMGGHTPVEASLGDDIARVPGVDRVVGVRMRTLPWRDTRILLLAIDAAAYAPMAKVPVQGISRERALARLPRGDACVISTNLAALHGVGIGDVLTIPGVRGPVALEVLGLFSDYSWPRGTALVDLSVLRDRLDDPVVDEFSVKVAPGADVADVARRIDAAVGQVDGVGRELIVTDARQLQEAARDLLSDIFALSYAQVAVAMAVAFLGVLNALWIAVVMRRRELGLLRCVGATRRQVTLSLVYEGAALGLLGSVLGVAAGWGVEWVVIHRVLPVETGWVYPLRYPLGEALIILVLGILTSAAAGWLPARAAMAIPLRDAVGYE